MSNTLNLARFVAVGAIALLTASGCYDSQQLIERARNNALRTRLEEVDLGSYRITLPFDETTGSRTEIVLRLVGTAKRYRIADIEQRIKHQQYLLRQRTIDAVRRTSPSELADPLVADLRQRLLGVTNEVLEDQSIDALAIAELMIIPQ
jgi:hypothetical protein